MGNVTFKFKLGLMQSKSIKSPLEVVIDGNEIIKIEPGASVAASVADGSHSLKLYINVVEGHGDQGRMGIINTTFDVKPGKNYLLTYEYASMGQKGSVSVKEL
jgi:hypothetical protein